MQSGSFLSIKELKAPIFNPTSRGGTYLKGVANYLIIVQVNVVKHVNEQHNSCSLHFISCFKNKFINNHEIIINNKSHINNGSLVANCHARWLKNNNKAYASLSDHGGGNHRCPASARFEPKATKIKLYFWLSSIDFVLMQRGL